MMRGPFRRSGAFGLVGVVVVMVVVAVIALTMGQNQADPKAALALIFGVIAAFIAIVFFLQTRDVSAAESAALRAAAAQPAGPVTDPTVLDDGGLWAAMAIRPIDADAVKAVRRIWGTTRRSIHTGMLICLLIFLAVPPIYLLHTFVPLFIGAPAIVAIALYSTYRTLARGGGLDQLYALASQSMAPLGLTVTGRYSVGIEPRGTPSGGYQTAIGGALTMAGERHGRPVAVSMPASAGVRSVSSVRVWVPAAPGFGFRAANGRLLATGDAPPAVRDALAAVPKSSRWTGLHGTVADSIIAVDRKSATNSGWLLDLWLAERVADALARLPSGSARLASSGPAHPAGPGCCYPARQDGGRWNQRSPSNCAGRPVGPPSIPSGRQVSSSRAAASCAASASSPTRSRCRGYTSPLPPNRTSASRSGGSAGPARCRHSPVPGSNR